MLVEPSEGGMALQETSATAGCKDGTDTRRLLSQADNQATSRFLDWTESRTTTANTCGASAFWVRFQATVELLSALFLLALLGLVLLALAASLLEERSSDGAEAE